MPHPRLRRAIPPVVNDVHSALNLTRPAYLRRPESIAEVLDALEFARRRSVALVPAGGRHAMGGQQFLSGGCVLDMRGLNRIIDLDSDDGLVRVQAGATWPALMRGYLAWQHGRAAQWGIRQKQTGADSLTIGGAIAANIHGRGLDDRPFSMDVESLQLVTPDGEVLECARSQSPDWFRMVVGGYGLFGIVTAATLRLVPRRPVQRVVELISLPELMRACDARIADGYTYGDFQFATDPRSAGFLHDGVFSCYRPVEETRPVPANQLRLARADWQRLLALAHIDKRRAYEEFSGFYMRSSGQLYWSDTHQLNIYLDGYHEMLDRHLGACVRGSEMITELYVPRAALTRFMSAVREDFARHRVDLIYGTIRLIRRDQDAFLAWAKQDYACVIFNLHVDHEPVAMQRAREHFRRLIDRAIECGGSYFLTYHRYARRDQLLACYPEFPEFIRRKRLADPHERISSDWYRAQCRLLESGAVDPP